MIRYTYGYSRDVDPDALYWHLLKRAAAVMTPEAMQAGPAGMPPQGAPMDPSMMQGGMPPQGAPMDPSAMQGGMPPQGAPVDPSMMQGGGLPPEILQDQAFVQMLQQSGVMLDPQSGMFMDPSGQPVPPEMIVQAYEAYMQGQQAGQAGPGGMPPQGAPMDPSMAQGAMPPQDAPMDPSMVPEGPEGMPPQGAPAGGPEADGMLPEPVMNAISSIVASTVEPAVQDLTSQLGQALSDLAAKIDELSARLDAEKKEGTPSAEDVLRSEIEKDLQQQQQQQQLPQEEAVPQMKAASVSGSARSQLKPLNIFSLMSQNK